MAKRQTKNKRKRSVLAPSPPQMVILRVCMVLLALLLDEGGLIPQLLGNMGLTVPSFTAAAKAEVEKLPRVSGSGREQGKIYVAQDVDKCLNTAESIAASMKDEYVSVEHILLGLITKANSSITTITTSGTHASIGFTTNRMIIAPISLINEMTISSGP